MTTTRPCPTVLLLLLSAGCGARPSLPPAPNPSPPAAVERATSSSVGTTASDPNDGPPLTGRARVYFGPAPDDGPAYIIAIGAPARTPDARGGRCGIGTDGIHLSLGYKGMPRHGSPFTSPLTFRIAPNQDITEGWACRGAKCVGFEGGEVELENLRPERSARGRFRLVRRDGGIEQGTFDAVWCGPPLSQPGPSFPPTP